jgi:hypothetical protein
MRNVLIEQKLRLEKGLTYAPPLVTKSYKPRLPFGWFSSKDSAWFLDNAVAEPVELTRNWLGDLDSNQDSQIQNLESYRWTISQQLP